MGSFNGTVDQPAHVQAPEALPLAEQQGGKDGRGVLGGKLSIGLPITLTLLGMGRPIFQFFSFMCEKKSPPPPQVWMLPFLRASLFSP